MLKSLHGKLSPTSEVCGYFMDMYHSSRNFVYGKGNYHPFFEIHIAPDTTPYTLPSVLGSKQQVLEGKGLDNIPSSLTSFYRHYKEKQKSKMGP